MTYADIPFVLILVPILAVSALCSASETALLGLTYNERTRLAKRSAIAHRAVTRLLARPRPLLLSILIVNMAANVLYFVVSSVLAARVDGPGWTAGVGAATLMVIILAGEMLPKLLATAHRVGACAWLAPPIEILVRVVTPLRVLLDLLAVSPIARLISPRGERSSRTVRGEDLSALLETGARSGALDLTEHRLLTGVIELGQVRVRDVMIPRVAMEWLPKDFKRGDLMRLRNTRRLNLIPVCDPSPDDRVVGMLHLPRYLAAEDTGRATALRVALLPATFMPESGRLDQLLDHFRLHRTHVALCVDEHGAVSGIVDAQALVEELVTPPREQSDDDDEDLRRLGPGRWLVSGRLPVREWAEYLGLEGIATDRRVSTVAGLMLLHLRRVPKVGDAVEVAGVRMEVTSMSGPVIRRILVTASDAEESSP